MGSRKYWQNITKWNEPITYPGGAPIKTFDFFYLKNFHRQFRFREILGVAVGQVCSGACKPAGACLWACLTITIVYSVGKHFSNMLAFFLVFLRLVYVLYLWILLHILFTCFIFACCCLFGYVSCTINCALICLLVSFLCLYMYLPGCLIFCSVFLLYFIVFFRHIGLI